MRVALVNNQFQMGGAETVVQQLWRNVPGAELYVAEGRDLPHGVHSLVPYIWNRLYYSRFAERASRIVPRIAWTEQEFLRLGASGFDLIHLHNFHGQYASAESLAALARVKPLLWTLHGSWGITGGCDYITECRRYLNACGACPLLGTWPIGDQDFTASELERKARTIGAARMHVVCPSEFLAGLVRESRVGRNWDVHVIRNGVNPDQFQPTNRHSGGPIRILLAVRNYRHPQKGSILAEEALRALPPGEVEIVLCGESAEWQAERLAPHRCEVVGYVSDRARLARLYASADLFVFVSRSENFPCAVLEAMASGCCVVATPSGGVVEQIESGVNGVLADAIDGAAFRSALLGCWNNRVFQRAMGEAARRTVVEKFSERGMIQGYLDLYERLIDEGKRIRTVL